MADDYFSLDKTKSNFVTKELIEEFSDITARHDAVIALPLDGLEDKERQSGLITTSTSFSKEHSKKCVVLAIGPGKVTEQGERVPSELKKGDIVWYYSNAMQITRKGRATLLLRDEAVVMKLDKTIEDYWD